MGDLGKLIVAKGYKKLPKVQKIAQSCHTGSEQRNHLAFVVKISFYIFTQKKLFPYLFLKLCSRSDLHDKENETQISIKNDSQMHRLDDRTNANIR